MSVQAQRPRVWRLKMMLDPWWGNGPNVGLRVNILHVSALSVSSLVLPLILRDVSFFRLLQQCCSVSSIIRSTSRMHCIDCIIYLLRHSSLPAAQCVYDFEALSTYNFHLSDPTE